MYTDTHVVHRFGRIGIPRLFRSGFGLVSQGPGVLAVVSHVRGADDVVVHAAFCDNAREGAAGAVTAGLLRSSVAGETRALAIIPCDRAGAIDVLRHLAGYVSDTR